MTTHTLKVDKALLQSIVKDALVKKAYADLVKTSKTQGGHGSPHGKGGGRGGLGFAHSLKRTLTKSGQQRSNQFAAMQQDNAPVSDNKRWQQLQEAQSV